MTILRVIRNDNLLNDFRYLHALQGVRIRWNDLPWLRTLAFVPVLAAVCLLVLVGMSVWWLYGLLATLLLIAVVLAGAYRFRKGADRAGRRVVQRFLNDVVPLEQLEFAEQNFANFTLLAEEGTLHQRRERLVAHFHCPLDVVTPAALTYEVVRYLRGCDIKVWFDDVEHYNQMVRRQRMAGLR